MAHGVGCLVAYEVAYVRRLGFHMTYMVGFHMR